MVVLAPESEVDAWLLDWLNRSDTDCFAVAASVIGEPNNEGDDVLLLAPNNGAGAGLLGLLVSSLVEVAKAPNRGNVLAGTVSFLLAPPKGLPPRGGVSDGAIENGS